MELIVVSHFSLISQPVEGYKNSTTQTHTHTHKTSLSLPPTTHPRVETSHPFSMVPDTLSWCQVCWMPCSATCMSPASQWCCFGVKRNMLRFWMSMFTYFDIYIYTYMYTHIYIYALSHFFTRLGTHDCWILVDTVLGGFYPYIPILFPWFIWRFVYPRRVGEYLQPDLIGSPIEEGTWAMKKGPCFVV